MKHTVLFLAALLAIGGFSGEAKAALDTHDFGSDNIKWAEMGLVQKDWTGTIRTNNLPNYTFDKADGSLAAWTQIVFSYNVDPIWKDSVSSANFNVNPSVSAPDGSYKISESVVRDVTGAVTTFKVSIANLFSAPLDFWTSIVLPNYIGEVTTTYVTTQVPLPAALPLFGLGLIGLAGYKRMKKGNKAAA